MKVVVKDNYLNVRVGAPRVNAPCYQYLAPGSELEVDGKLYKGDKYGEAGIDTWLKDAAGNYYWSGGVTAVMLGTADIDVEFQAVVNGTFDGLRLKTPIDYHALLKVSPTVKAAKGQGVSVGILDHPISSGLTTIGNVNKPFHVADPLLNFHGNFIAGLIGGNRNIMGLANRCQMVELPMYNAKAGSTGVDIEGMLRSIKDSAEPMIINISNSLEEKYNDILRRFPTNKILIACAGIDEELSAPNVRDPASLPNVIAVGAVSKVPTQRLNPKIDFVVPNFDYVSLGRSDSSYERLRGDSFACAVVSAAAALLVSSGKCSYELFAIKTELSRIAIPLSAPQPFNFLNIINVKS
jgi:hypothetical protein